MNQRELDTGGGKYLHLRVILNMIIDSNSFIMSNPH